MFVRRRLALGALLTVLAALLTPAAIPGLAYAAPSPGGVLHGNVVRRFGNRRAVPVSARGLAPRSAGGCPSSVMFGVRGSGESSSLDNGFGATIGPIAALLGDDGVTAVAVRYLAVHVPSELALYPLSLAMGIRHLDDDVAGLVARCPDSRIALAGYSQGAEVVGDAYQAHMTTAERAHVVGIVLVGDPLFNWRQGGSVNVGSFKHFDGILARGEPREWPSADDAFVRSLCANHDPICNDSSPGLLASCEASDCAHYQYDNALVPRTSVTYTTYAARFLWSRFAATAPVPPPTTTPTPAPPSPVPVIEPPISFDGNPGTDSPPSTLAQYTMQPFAADPSAEGTDESSITGPTGLVSFDSPLQHDLVGSEWETWSNGYEGDVYEDATPIADGSFEITVTLPPGTGAFYAYAEPEQFEDFDMSATAQDGTTSGPTTVYGMSGAQYFGFYASCGHTISSVTFTDSSDDDAMAIGEFGIAPAC